MSDFFSYDKPAAAAPAPAAARAILGELSAEEWEKFIGYAVRRRYPAGAEVLGIGDAAGALYFVASGAVELRGPTALPATGRRLLGRPAPAAASTERRGEGEVFGVLSFLDGAPSAVSATVAAGGPADLLLLDLQALQQLAAWQPRIALTLLRDLGGFVAQRLRALGPQD